MELPLHIIPKVVNLEVQLVVEVQTRWVVIVVNSMVGSNNSWEPMLVMERIFWQNRYYPEETEMGVNLAFFHNVIRIMRG